MPGCCTKLCGRGISYEDVEGFTISLGIIYALLLPSALVLQNQGFDEGVQSKNLLLLLCTEHEFRDFAVETLDSPKHQGGTTWNVSLGGDTYLDAKAVLQNGSVWQWDKGSPEALYPCGEKKEIAATARAVLAMLPTVSLDTWILSHPEAGLWSDHLSAMTSFGMSLVMAGLLGSLGMYLSLSLSDGREDESGVALSRWSTIGFPTMVMNLFLLLASIIVLLFTNDAYTESQDPFFLRSGRFGGYSKIAMLAVFLPIIVFFIAGSMLALCRSMCKDQEDPDRSPSGDLQSMHCDV